MSAAPVPSHHVEAEEDVLGAILSAASYSVEAGHRVLDRALATGLLPSHFWRESHAHLYGLLGTMRDRGLPVDPLAVAVELEGVDAPAHIVGRLHVLARQVVAFGVVEHRASVVMEAARLREVEEVRRWT